MRPRVRPHVERAVARVQRIVLDFDGVVCDVGAGHHPATAGAALEKMLRRPGIPFLRWFVISIDDTTDYLVRTFPALADEADQLLRAVEMNGSLLMPPVNGLVHLFEACRTADVPVAITSDMAEDVILAYLRAHDLSRHVSAVAARQGADFLAARADAAIDRICTMWDVDPSVCLYVSGSGARLRAVQRTGTTTIGCECRRDKRKHMASPDTPVVSGLPVLTQAMSDRSPATADG